MTRSKKALMAGAALAGLLAGSGATIQASNLLTGTRSFTAQDQSQDKKDDKKVKEKHACKGQNSCKGKGGCKTSDNGCKGKNSCKGKGGCATDGSKPTRVVSNQVIRPERSGWRTLPEPPLPDQAFKSQCRQIDLTLLPNTVSDWASASRTTSTS